MTKIGSLIVHFRKQKSLSQNQLAKLLKTSQSAVVRMEKGKQNFTTEMLTKLSKALGQDLLTYTPGVMHYQVEGGRKLTGKIQVKTSKNSAVALLFASLLNRGTTLLKAMPRIEEVNRIIEVLTSIGVSILWEGDDIRISPPKTFQLHSIDREAGMKTRSIILLLGALSGRLSHYSVPYPGGCAFGKRTVMPNVLALQELGLDISFAKNHFLVNSTKRKAGHIVMYEASDIGTENALFAAASLPGTTLLKFASSNYQVQDTCLFLQQLGVSIEGIGTSTLTIRGKPAINSKITFYPSEDPIEAMLFLTAAIVTKSSITIERCPIDFLELELYRLQKMGFKYKILKRYKSKNGFTNLVDVKTFPSKLTAPKDKLHPLPYPGINIDNLPFFVPIATQSKGRTLIHDWPYENRAIYYLELNKLGANITFLDPHRVFIDGPTVLKPSEIVAPPALRPAAIILVSMLAAKGKSILRNVYSINRGYEDICPRLNSLGAKIKILHEI